MCDTTRAEVSMGFTLEVLLAVVAVVAVAAWFFLQNKGAKPVVAQPEQPAAVPEQPAARRNAPQAVAARPQPAQPPARQLPAAGAGADSDDEGGEGGDGEGDGDGEAGEEEIDLSLLSKKELAKVMKKR